MAKLVVTEFISLDGVYEDPGGSEGKSHGPWTFAYWNDQIARYKTDELDAAESQLLGRVTYEGFAEAWPSREPGSPEEDPFTHKMNSMRKYVVSTTLKRADWNNSQVISGNVVDEINRLRREPGGDILVAGSGTLVKTLQENGLIDELHLLVYPIILGSGKRLFQNGTTRLRLVESRPFDTGAVALNYVPAAA
jgi:dihydrofolate reductase